MSSAFSPFMTPMPRFLSFLRGPTLAALLLAGGCAHHSPLSGIRDQRIYNAERRAAERALSAAEDVTVFFRMEETGDGGNRGGGSRAAAFSGVVLTPEGHVLAPFAIRPDSDSRIEAWIGEQRYLARPLQMDEGLGMTILKVMPNQPLVPIDFETPGELRTGESAFAVVSTDQEREFGRFVFRGFCQGVIEGRYRQYSLNPLPSTTRGAPLYNAHGTLVGLVNPSNAWALTDLAVDLEDFIDRAIGEKGEKGDEAEDAWFGAILAPVNPDYARANDLPRSGLWLVYVFGEGSAAEAGFQNGDLLVELDGEPLRLSGRRAYQYFMQALRPREDKPFTATVLRDGKRIKGKASIKRRPEPDTLRAEDLGVSVSDVNESMVVRFNLFESDGVMVTDVKPGSPAATGRTFGDTLLRPRDVITALGGHPTPDVEAFGEALGQIRRDKPAALLVEFRRGPVTGYEALNLRIGDLENGANP